MKKRNKFSLSNYKLLTGAMGKLLPIGLYEVLPGDTIQQNTSLFIRMAAMVTPVMHPLRVRIHHWYVPLRLIWDDFEDFITGGADGMDVSVPPYQVKDSAFSTGTLADYFGLPISPLAPPKKFSALPFRAYDLIYNEWYRDQDLEAELVFSKASGLDTTTVRDLQACDWERDYFTTARPWPQKGPAVTVPIQGAPGDFSIIPDPSQPYPTFTPTRISGSSGSGITPERYMGTGYPGQSSGQPFQPYMPHHYSNQTDDTFFDREDWLNSGLKFSTGSGSLGSLDINALREAFALQKFEEHRAMYGSRYTEYLRYLGIKASDSRLQRPEYLGGGSSTIQFSEVIQTGANMPADIAGPVGTLRGHGIGAMRSNRFRRFIEEHGFIISLMSAIPKTIYMQATPRLWTRETKEDYWQRELEHVGQQEVYVDELYPAYNADGTRKVFGYQNRYDEYREIQSSVCGQFRNSEKYWHLARDFANEPVLNASFVKANPSARIFADPGTEGRQAQQMYIMANHSIQARRLLSRNGNPI
jgi:hypothetical protein